MGRTAKIVTEEAFYGFNVAGFAYRIGTSDSDYDPLTRDT